MSSQGGVGRREVAWRIFAAEYDDSSLEHSDSDEERAPNYVVTPTGARINRLFVVGVLTEIEQVGDDVLRARIVDPTGGFVVYAGQYQPDALAFLERADPPMFVAVTGKARTFQPEDSDLVYTSIRPESINAVDAETRDRWVVQTAEQTLSRIRTFAGALDSDQYGEELQHALEATDVDTGLAAGVPLALDHYRTSTPYLAELQDVALDATRVVAGEQDEVGSLDVSPDEPGDVTLDVDVSLETPAVETGADETPTTEAEPETEFGTEVESETEPTEFESSEQEPESEPTDADLSEAEPTEPESTFETESKPASESATETTVPDSDQEPETPPAQAREPAETDEPVEPEPVGETGVEEFDTEPSDETTADEPDEPADDLGDFDTGASDDDLGDFDDQQMGEDVSGEMYEFDEGEREQIEEEFGTEFTSGAEVGEPGEADIETPEPAQEMTAESEAEPEPDTAAEPAEATGPDADAAQPEQTEATEPEPTPSEDSEPEAAAESEPESAGDDGEKPAPENLENTVMEVMRGMNDGDGVERERLLAGVVDSYDVTPADVEDALQDALMAGRCYESGEETLKPI
jgi:RPA family protein